MNANNKLKSAELEIKKAEQITISEAKKILSENINDNTKIRLLRRALCLADSYIFDKIKEAIPN